MSKSQRIKSLLSDEDFRSVVTDVRAALTKKVMAKATTPEDRQQLLAEYHALDRLLAKMGAEASRKETE